MARNLAKAESDLLVFDRDPAALSDLVERGARAATSVGDVARQADVIFLSLPGPAQIEDVVFGQDGILANIRTGAALFDLSTSSRGLAIRIEQALRERDAYMFDAPISGGPAGAETGELVIWVGGDEDEFARHEDVLRSFSRWPIFVGPIGAGTVTKLTHNMVSYMILLAFAETFSVAVKAGLDPLNLWKALRFGVVGKRSPLDMLVKQFLPGEYETPAFALELAHKDVTLATSLAKELGVPMRLANLTLEEMTEALSRGFAGQDSRAYLKLQLERSGVQIAVDAERLRAAVEESEV
jgi:3-hydroxyisobutyrate dehydrogenase